MVSVNHGEMQRCAPQPFETRFKTDKSVATTALGVIGRTCATQHLASQWALPVRDQAYKCWQETALLVRMRMRYRSVTGRHVTGRPPGPRHALALDLSIPTPPTLLPAILASLRRLQLPLLLPWRVQKRKIGVEQAQRMLVRTLADRVGPRRRMQGRQETGHQVHLRRRCDIVQTSE